MTYLWVLLASLSICLVISVVHLITMRNLIRKLQGQQLILRVAKRWRSSSYLAISFAILYFSVRIYQFTVGLHELIYIIVDMLSLALMTSAAIASRKNARIIKYLGDVGK